MDRSLALCSVFALAAAGSWGVACSDSEDSGPSSDAGPLNDALVADPDASAEEAAVLTYDATVPKLESGEGFGLVYSADQNIGIDGRPNVAGTFDSKGLFIGYNASANENLQIASATQAGAGTDGNMSWGAWAGGPTSGVFYTGRPKGDFTFEQGFHYAVGKIAPKANIPVTGTANYILSGASFPKSNRATEAGSLTAIAMAVDFASSKIGVELSGMMGGTTFGINTPGGLADPSTSDAKLSSTGDFITISATPTPASYALRAYFVGSNASGIVVAYQVNRSGGEVIFGSAALKKQ